MMYVAGDLLIFKDRNIVAFGKGIPVYFRT